MASTKPRAVLPHGFLQVPAVDRSCDSLDRPTPSARRFCLTISRDIFWYLMILTTRYHCSNWKYFISLYPTPEESGFYGNVDKSESNPSGPGFRLFSLPWDPGQSTLLSLLAFHFRYSFLRRSRSGWTWPHHEGLQAGQKDLSFPDL